MARRRWAIASLGVLAAAIAVIGAALAVRYLFAPTAPRCDGERIAPSEDIQDAIDSRPGDTTFCLAAGTYRVDSTIVPATGNRFIGAGMSLTHIVGDRVPIVFDARGSSDLVFAHLTISGADGHAGCRPQCGSGLTGGADVVVDSVRFHDNRNHGIGGSDGGLVVTNSVLDHNGSRGFAGCCAGGIKAADGFTITGSHVFANEGNGVWCDSGCSGDLVVRNNRISGNSQDGIRYEVSGFEGPGDHALIEDNTIEDNNTSDLQGGHGGVAIVASDNVVVAANVLGGNAHAGVIVADTGRGRSSNVVVRDNELNGDEIVGCGRRVLCEGNRV